MHGQMKCEQEDGYTNRTDGSEETKSLAHHHRAIVAGACVVQPDRKMEKE